MQTQRPHAERSRDLERLLTFIDAIAAVAITLLILPLVELAGEIHSEDDSVSGLIRSHGGQFWSFALSFGVIARVWLAQHRLMSPVVAANRAIVASLVMWTLAIVFLPFPTALLSNGGEQTITKVLYIGCLAASSVCLAVLAVAVQRDSAVRVPGETPTARPALITAILLVLALVIALAVPSTGYYPLFLLVASDLVDYLWRRLITRSDPARRAPPTSRSRSE